MGGWVKRPWSKAGGFGLTGRGGGGGGGAQRVKKSQARRGVLIVKFVACVNITRNAALELGGRGWGGCLVGWVGVLWGGVATDATFAAASFYRTTHTSVFPCLPPPLLLVR